MMLAAFWQSMIVCQQKCDAGYAGDAGDAAEMLEKWPLNACACCNIIDCRPNATYWNNLHLHSLVTPIAEGRAFVLLTFSTLSFEFLQLFLQDRQLHVHRLPKKPLKTGLDHGPDMAQPRHPVFIDSLKKSWKLE